MGRRLWLNRRDWINLAGARFMSLGDPVIHIRHRYHLAQAIPTALLDSADNPYRALAVRPLGARSRTDSCLEN